MACKCGGLLLQGMVCRRPLTGLVMSDAMLWSALLVVCLSEVIVAENFVLRMGLGGGTYTAWSGLSKCNKSLKPDKPLMAKTHNKPGQQGHNSIPVVFQCLLRQKGGSKSCRGEIGFVWLCRKEAVPSRVPNLII